jgi:hypothetical protein
MSTLRFSDGMVIHTDGPLRVIRKKDGYYVVGEGMCCPVDSREDGDNFIKSILSKRGVKNG